MAVRTPTVPLGVGAAPYLAFLDQWLAELEETSCNPLTTAVLVIDMVEGFCEHGQLASPRIHSLISPIVSFLSAYSSRGGREVLIAEDTHPEDAREFRNFPPHCLVGTSESHTVSAIAALAESSWRRFPKQTINALAEPAVRDHLATLVVAGITDFVVVGDCTDLCVYQAAMALQLLFNRTEESAHRDARVIVPVQLVETYDLPLDIAVSVGATPHPGDLLHAVFLHHMQLNGVVIVRSVNWLPA